ncbi:MAG: hypothetical protein NVSMB52_11830 [Chloroflexota bacterium]
MLGLMMYERPIFDDGGALTVWFLLDRGFCCGNGCTNCPYEPRHGGPAAFARENIEIADDGGLKGLPTDRTDD